MALEPEIPYLEPRAVASLMKLGGKKKLDALMAVLDASGPLRLADLQNARDLAAAKAAAQALKPTAAGLGLARLEDLCDQILARRDWKRPDPLGAQVEQAFEQGRRALHQHRAGL